MGPLPGDLELRLADVPAALRERCRSRRTPLIPAPRLQRECVAGCTPSPELYDPATETFVAGPMMISPRRNHTAALLGSGRVLIAGGNPTSMTTTASTELFVPGAETFTPGAPLGTALSLIESVALSDGRVLMVGGQGMTGLVSRGSKIFTD